jgi:hypothetical protein
MGRTNDVLQSGTSETEVRHPIPMQVVDAVGHFQRLGNVDIAAKGTRSCSGVIVRLHQNWNEYAENDIVVALISG